MKIKRDTTSDLFNAVVALVKENGHYEKAAAIMDYYMPTKSDSHKTNYPPLELSNYEFDFVARVKLGGSEGIYIGCYIEGSYTETPRTKYDHGLGKTVPEYCYSIGTFKTLRDDLIAMQIMGELCGSLTFYASMYINENLDRYTPTARLTKNKKTSDQPSETEVSDGD